jgi:hypothetical protein
MLKNHFKTNIHKKNTKLPKENTKLPKENEFFFNEDILQNILLAVDFDSLINLYLTNKFFKKLLESKNIIVHLSNKFNIIDVGDVYTCEDTYIIGVPDNFSKLVENYGSFMVPNFLTHNYNYIDKALQCECRPKDGEIVYYTHFNGGYPYKVTINKNIVKIFEQGKKDNECLSEGEESSNECLSEGKNSESFYEIEISLYICEDIFVGKSPGNEISHLNDNYDNLLYKYVGNTILLHIKDKEYIYICGILTVDFH